MMVIPMNAVDILIAMHWPWAWTQGVAVDLPNWAGLPLVSTSLCEIPCAKTRLLGKAT